MTLSASLLKISDIMTWFKHLLQMPKGETVEVQGISLVDDYLVSESALFSEWSSPEDEAAFRDL